MENRIISVPRSEVARAMATLMSGFIADPITRWFYPSAHDYFHWFPVMTNAFAELAAEDGTLYADAEYRAAAIWLAPGKKIDEEALANLVKSSYREERLEDVMQLFAEMDRYHPSDEPCWYLPVIAADVTHQGRGLGGALMKHALKRCDEDGALAYLESSNPQNMTLYERHGFRVIGRIEAGSAPPVHPMIREPLK